MVQQIAKIKIDQIKIMNAKRWEIGLDGVKQTEIKYEEKKVEKDKIFENSDEEEGDENI